MNNTDVFKRVFGIYAEEFWSYPKDKMLDWLQYENVPDKNVGDMISRQGALSMLSTDLDKIPMVNNSANDMIRRDERIMCIDTIKALPPAEPQRKRGKWIWEDNENRFGWTCSECGYGIRGDRAQTNYCPNCGSEMVKGEEDDK